MNERNETELLNCTTEAEPTTADRRAFLKVAAGVSAAALLPGTLGAAQAQMAADSVVKAGDMLVYAEGPQAKKPIKLADVKIGVAIPALAIDPKTKAPRDAVKGGVVVTRVKTPSADSVKNAVQGVVAYSSVCTHQGCPSREIGTLGSGKGKIICTCHGSQYDPADNAKVVGGPAPRRLPALPLKASATGELTAAAGFTGRVGPGK